MVRILCLQQPFHFPVEVGFDRLLTGDLLPAGFG